MRECMATQENTEPQKKLQGFAAAEAQRLEEERQKAMEEHGYAPFWTMAEGTHIIEFADAMPRENNLYPDRPIFRVKIGSEEWDYSISKRSPLYREVMQHLADGEFRLSITRIGTGKSDTRYKVQKA